MRRLFVEFKQQILCLAAAHASDNILLLIFQLPYLAKTILHQPLPFPALFLLPLLLFDVVEVLRSFKQEIIDEEFGYLVGVGLNHAATEFGEKVAREVASKVALRC